MGTQTNRVQPRSQASGLSGDVLGILRGQLQGGGGGGGGGGDTNVSTASRLGSIFSGQGDPGGGGGGLNFDVAGLGLGPLQREAGTAARQFVSSVGGGSFDTSDLVADLEEIQNRRVGEQTADLREGFGIAGSRFGTPLAIGESRLRRDLETNFSAQLGELFRQEFSAQQNRQLQGIALLQNLGVQNIEPFLRLAQLGILPEQIFQSPDLFAQLLGGATGVAGGVAAFL